MSSRLSLDATEATLTVDLDALAANYRLLAGMAPGARTAPVVKADGYGLGVGPLARRLWTEGARAFFVARVAEGEALRRELGSGRPAVVYVLDGCPQGAAGRLDCAGLTPVLNSLVQIEDWAAHARVQGRCLACALHIDTGLNRLGLRVEEAAALAMSPDRLRALDLTLVMSHLACGADPGSPMNPGQAQRFAQAAELFPGVQRSLANSSGIFLGEAYHGDLTRPGISLVGGGPFGRTDARLAPVATLDAPILQVRSVPAGETIGYGATFAARRPMRVAVVASGYADGVLRAASPEAYGWLDGQRCNFVGRVSMDLIALDVTDRQGAHPGAMIELLGPNVPVDEAAAAAGSIAFELLVRLAPRLRRVYVGDDT